MAKKITLNIANDAKAVEIRDVIIENMVSPPYQDTVEDPEWTYDPENPTMPGQVPNPVTRDAFFKQHLIEMVKNLYQRGKKSMVAKHEMAAINNEDLELS